MCGVCVVCVWCVCVVCVVCARHVSVNTRLYKHACHASSVRQLPHTVQYSLHEYTCRYSFSYLHTNFEQLCNVLSSLIPRLSQVSLGMRLGRNLTGGAGASLAP